MIMPVAARKVSDDPLDEVLRPPPDETQEQQTLRIAREEQARQVSLAIDASIKAERQARRKKRIVRLLLLGQSESGKSTTLRQFQRLYTPTAFREERILWRAVIQLNIIKSIRTILDALSPGSQVSPQTSPYASPRSRSQSISQQPMPSARIPPLPVGVMASHNGNGNGSDYSNVDDIQFSHASPARAHYVNRHHHQLSNPDSDPDSDSDNTNSRFNPSSSTLTSSPFEALKARLLPLRHIEALLIAKLVPPNEEEATHLAPPGTPTGTYISQHRRSEVNKTAELFVRPGPGWKGGLSRARVTHASFSGSDDSVGSMESSPGRPSSAGNVGLETQDEPQEVLHACRKDMMQLWRDEGIRDILWKRKIRIEEFPGFFLDDLERVTSLKYMPTDDDVLKARLKTVGVSEYKFEMEITAGRDYGTEWRIVDVGGSRSQRPTWAPFFDDVDAIIFLAPISGFDQVLAEDRSVNRLEDSVLLWKAVCSNKLLAHVDLILFLNKCDILEKKLNAGIRLAKYVRSYGDRDNDIDTVSKYFRSKFSAIHREYSPNPRKFYAFCTSVTDTATTAGIIASVRDMVIRQHLKQSKLM